MILGTKQNHHHQQNTQTNNKSQAHITGSVWWFEKDVVSVSQLLGIHYTKRHPNRFPSHATDWHVPSRNLPPCISMSKV